MENSGNLESLIILICTIINIVFVFFGYRVAKNIFGNNIKIKFSQNIDLDSLFKAKKNMYTIFDMECDDFSLAKATTIEELNNFLYSIDIIKVINNKTFETIEKDIMELQDIVNKEMKSTIQRKEFDEKYYKCLELIYTLK